MKEEGSHPKKKNKLSVSYRQAKHQQSLSNYFKVNCEPLITSGNRRNKTLLANYISKSFRLIDATYYSVLLSLSFSPSLSPLFPFLSLPNFLFHIAENSIKAVFPLAAVSMTAHTDTMRHSPGSAVNHNQLVNNWHRFIIISSGPKLYV